MISFSTDFVHISNDSLALPDFKKANFDDICSTLSFVDWPHLISCANEDIQTLYNLILNELHFTIIYHVPITKSALNRNSLGI